MLDPIPTMNHEVELAALVQNLLLKKVIDGENCEFYRNMISNVHVSPQATRKKRFTSLNLERSRAFNAITPNNTLIL
jgi:hypothetical protein